MVWWGVNIKISDGIEETNLNLTSGKITRYCEHLPDDKKEKAGEYILKAAQVTLGSINVQCNGCDYDGGRGCVLKPKSKAIPSDEGVEIEINYRTD